MKISFKSMIYTSLFSAEILAATCLGLDFMILFGLVFLNFLCCLASFYLNSMCLIEQFMLSVVFSRTGSRKPESERIN